MSPRVRRVAVVAVTCAAVWLAAGVVQAWAARALVRGDVVAGLISPQGVSAAGVAEIVAFVGLRLLVVLAGPGAAAFAVTVAALSAPRPPTDGPTGARP